MVPPPAVSRPTNWSKTSVNPNYWVIHGKSYDLNEFAARHPGGEYILMLGKGRDCTELFESVHALSGIDGPRSLLSKFEVKGEPEVPGVFEWKEDGFYSVLRNRVHDRFKDRNYKATWFVYMKIVLLACLYLYSWISAFTTGNWWWAISAGLVTEMIGFCVMHESSHNAVSKKPIINYLGLLWSSWMLWNHWLWLQHHVYGHHSYTGVFGKDPDIHNVDFLIRKHKRTKPNPTTSYQHIYSWMMYLLVPGQHIAQIIMYQVTPKFFDRIFNLPLVHPDRKINLHSYGVFCLSLVFHFLIPCYYQSFWTVLFLWTLMYSMMGISYFLNVAPNHDTAVSHEQHLADGLALDWGEQQVRCTSNHSLGSNFLHRLISNLWGGMNYQIEHHLFPSLNHSHYPEVSQIVRDTCKEFNLPYNDCGSWWASLKSYQTMLASMATLPYREEKQD